MFFLLFLLTFFARKCFRLHDEASGKKVCFNVSLHYVIRSDVELQKCYNTHIVASYRWKTFFFFLSENSIHIVLNAKRISFRASIWLWQRTTSSKRHFNVDIYLFCVYAFETRMQKCFPRTLIPPDWICLFVFIFQQLKSSNILWYLICIARTASLSISIVPLIQWCIWLAGPAERWLRFWICIECRRRRVFCPFSV